MIYIGKNINSFYFDGIPSDLSKYNIKSIPSYLYLTPTKLPNSLKVIGEKAIRLENKETSIIFNGSKEEWRSIEKYDWISTPKKVTFTLYINCNDGMITYHIDNRENITEVK